MIPPPMPEFTRRQWRKASKRLVRFDADYADVIQRSAYCTCWRQPVIPGQMHQEWCEVEVAKRLIASTRMRLARGLL